MASVGRRLRQPGPSARHTHSAARDAKRGPRGARHADSGSGRTNRVLRIDVASTLLDGALLVEEGDATSVAYRLTTDGNVRTIELPERMRDLDFSPVSPIGVGISTEGNLFVTLDEGRSWQPLELPAGYVMNETATMYCTFEACTGGGLVISLGGTFPSAPPFQIVRASTPSNAPIVLEDLRWQCSLGHTPQPQRLARWKSRETSSACATR